jgi:MFS family permease
VDAVARLGSASALFAFKDRAWRQIFWMSLPPGILFTVGAFFVSESPRWLLAAGARERALAALRRSRTVEDADLELAAMEQSRATQGTDRVSGQARESLLQRKYVVPFVLACMVLSFNQLTGVNSIIGYNTGILLQSGLNDLLAHWGYLLFTSVNFLATIIGVVLVDRVGRRALLIFGTCGVTVAMLVVGLLFARTERGNVDVSGAVQSMAAEDGGLQIRFTPEEARRLLEGRATPTPIDARSATMQLIYTCGDYTSTTDTARSDAKEPMTLQASKAVCLPGNAVEAVFKNPFGSLRESRRAPVRVVKALIGAVPTPTNGWYVAAGLCFFIACYAMGPGVCVWLALSELMPTRIRSNGMSVALLLNQTVSTLIAAFFLPFVARFGYSRSFFGFALCACGYLLTAVFLLPETKGKTLEEIEVYFDSGARSGARLR